ncbi:MFS transporter [Erysipelothrix larvae]
MTSITPFLTSLGYDIVQRGTILSGYALTTILFQMFFGILADRFQTIRKVLIASLIIFGITSAILFVQSEMNYIFHFIINALSIGLLNTCCGLMDTWVLSSGEEPKAKLSFIKAFGSIGWAISSIIASILVLHFSYAYLSATIVIITIFVLINVIRISDIKKINHTKKIQMSDLAGLFKDRKYALLVFILFLLYSIIVANNGIVIDKMLELGATNTQISYKWTLQSLLEIPTYLFGYRILRRYNHFNLLQLSAFVITIQFVLYSFTSNVIIMILLNLLQMFTTPLVLITSKILIFNLSDTRLKSSSQLVALSIFTGVSSLLMPTVASALSTIVGINKTLFCVALLGVFASILIPKLKQICEI